MLRIGQVESSATADGKYTDGSVAGGIAATRLRAVAFNAIQEELAHIVESAGLSLDPNDMSQVFAALNIKFLSSSSMSQSTGASQTAVMSQKAVTDELNLANAQLAKIVAAGTFQIGVPFYWPLAVMPSEVIEEWKDMEFFKASERTFDKSKYPRLAKVWPGLIIPDMRGEFIRVADDGRGVDIGRELLSYQGDAIRNITAGNFRTVVTSNASTAPTGAIRGSQVNSLGGTGIALYESDFSAERVVPTAKENRPRSIALGVIIRAK